MRITIESTSKTTFVNGVPARIWEGTTASGIAVIAYVTRIAAQEGQDLGEFERELQETRKPSPEAARIAPRLIL